MTARGDGAAADDGRDDGWDETVVVWNATVARIPASGVQPDRVESADDDTPPHGATP